MDTANIPQSDGALDRRMVATDLWPRRLLERREGDTVVLPAKVFWPRHIEDVQRVIQAARAHGWPVVPYGAGSGVCAGVSPTDRAVVLDVKRLDELRIDPLRRECWAGAGLMGERLERQLNARGFTLGHFPSSIYCSTVGGWVAARSAGQLSSRYGKIEDLLLGVRGVNGRGDIIEAHLDDDRTGPAALRFLVGSEGALCVFTAARFRIHPVAEARWMRGFRFDVFEDGVRALRTVLQRGHAPSVLRLYDPLDTLVAGGLAAADDAPDVIEDGPISAAGLERSGKEGDDELSVTDRIAEHLDRLALFDKPRATRRIVGGFMGRPLIANTLIDRVLGHAKLIVGIEGARDDLEVRADKLKAALIAAGGQDAGPAPGAKWLLHRHRVSYKMARAFAAGGWVDTMEVATSHDGVVPLYRAVREALRDVAMVMCHFSHAYVDGCSLYFTFAGGGHAGNGPRSAKARYDAAWRRALLTVKAHGATVSHHHGVGRSKRNALEHAPGARAVLDALKRAHDPDGILNPGVLGLGTR